MTQEASQTTEARSLTDIVDRIAKVSSQKADLEATRLAEHEEAHDRHQRAKTAYEASKAALEQELDEDPLTTHIMAIEEELEVLRDEATIHFDPDGERTFRGENGAGVQFRASVKTIIKDEAVFAHDLADSGYWDDVGASIKVDAKKMQDVIDAGVSFDGVSVDVVPTTALLKPKENDAE